MKISFVIPCYRSEHTLEAVVKEIAMAHCRDRYVLADHDKFGKVSSVTFGAFQSAIILTDRKVPGIEDAGNVIVV